MYKLCVEQQRESCIQILICVRQSLNDGLQHVPNFRTLDDRANLFNCLNCCGMNLLVGVIQNLSKMLDNLRKKSADLLGCTVGHVAKCLYSCVLTAPVVFLQLLKELRQRTFDSIVAKVCHDSF